MLEKLPGVSKTIQEREQLSLYEYAEGLFQHSAKSIQPRDDLIEVIGAYSGRLLGRETAALLQRHFEETPVVLTANHHGVSYKTITLHGQIIFALPRIFDTSAEGIPVVPVLACGIVPLNNVTFPRGIALAREIEVAISPESKIKTFLKMPVIPGKFSQSMVSVAGPITESMVSRALKVAEKLFRQGVILECERNAIVSLLGEEYSRTEVLSQPDYSDQAVILNRSVWRRVFSAAVRKGLPDMAYLEMERVVSALMEKDILNPESLMHNIFFDPVLRTEILGRLDGKRGCWDHQKLVHLSGFNGDHHPGGGAFRGCGTEFFCFVDDRGRRVPGMLSRAGSSLTLRGIAPGKDISLPFTPEALCNGLRQRRLIPGLFVSFATLAFARGLKCIGGFMQVEYLPTMQRSLVQALECRGLHDWAQNVAQVPTANFVTGMNVAFSVYPDGDVKPAGAVELIAGGGLTEKDLEKIRAIPVYEANMSGLLESYSEVVFDKNQSKDLLSSISEGDLERFRNKLVRIRLN